MPRDSSASALDVPAGGRAEMTEVSAAADSFGIRGKAATGSQQNPPSVDESKSATSSNRRLINYLRHAGFSEYTE